MPSAYEKEMRRIEQTLTNLRDKYNTLETPETIADDYRRSINADLDYAPSKGETYESYYQRIKIYQKLSEKKNYQTHIENNGRKAWHTHVLPSGCFMCEDLQFINILVQTLQYIAHFDPKHKFES